MKENDTIVGMDAKEKANHLVKRYWIKNKVGQDSFEAAIKNALICVDEILNSDPSSPNTVDAFNYEGAKVMHVERNEQARYFWQEVKTEIKKL